VAEPDQLVARGARLQANLDPCLIHRSQSSPDAPSVRAIR
jgi:hypothetical protein